MREHWPALVAIAAFCVLATLYSLVTPPFETPDEVYHYAFARHIAQGNGLPVQTADGSGPWEQEGSQAPLYYAAVGLLTAGIDQDDFPALAVRNPRANIGDPLFPGNKNVMLYSGAAHPLRGANLALHVGRWLSVLLGALTLWFTYLTARRVFPGEPGRTDRRALLCLLLPAAIPQFAFLSGAFTNDSLIVATSAAAIWWLARLVSVEPPAQPRAWEWAVLGGIVGLAALSKLQGIGLLAVAGAAALALAWQRRDWRLPLRAALPLLLPLVAIAGWWYWRNVQLYGDWTGLAHLLEINGRRAGSLSPADWWLEFRGLRYSFWGLFGWFNILLPQWVYWVLDAATLLAALGLIGALAQRRRSGRMDAPNRVLGLALLWSALSFALLVYWTLRATGSQGRLLFPAIGTLAILFVLGLEWWLRPPALHRARTAAWAALLALLVGSSAYALAVLLPRSYRPDPPVAGAPPSAQPVNIAFEGTQGERLELAAVEIPGERFRPGDDVPVTLYLRAPERLATDYELFVQLLDETGAEIANVTSHPGWGRNPTTLWQPGALYADHYQVRITGPVDGRAPLLARVYTGFIDPATSDRGNFPLTARDAAGNEVTPFVGQVAVSPHAGPDAAGLERLGSVFGDVIALVGARVEPEGVQAGETLTVTLLYEAQGAPATDYTAFVHLRGPDGATVAGFDQRPAGERFPTAAWRAGDRIEATFPLTLPDGLPPGEYTLWTGLYETASRGALRLPVTQATGVEAGDGEVRVGDWRVEIGE